MTKRIIFSILALLFLTPFTTHAVIDLGDLRDLYFGDSVTVQWELSNTTNSDVSVYLVSRNSGTDVLISSGKSSEGNLSFIVPVGLPVLEDYRVEVTVDGKPNSVLAHTGWFEVLGERSKRVTSDNSGSIVDLNNILVNESDLRVKTFSVDTKKDGKIDVDWRVNKKADVSIWATCSEEITLFYEEGGTGHECPLEEDGEVHLARFDQLTSGELTIQPRDVSGTTRATFKMYVLDEAGVTVSNKEKTETIHPRNLTFETDTFSNTSVSTSGTTSSGSTNSSQSSEERIKEITDLVRVLGIDVDLDLIRLLVLLEVL